MRWVAIHKSSTTANVLGQHIWFMSPRIPIFSRTRLTNLSFSPQSTKRNQAMHTFLKSSHQEKHFETITSSLSSKMRKLAEFFAHSANKPQFLAPIDNTDSGKLGHLWPQIAQKRRHWGSEVRVSVYQRQQGRILCVWCTNLYCTVHVMHGLLTAMDSTAVQYRVKEWLVIIAHSPKILVARSLAHLKFSRSLARSLKIYSLARSLTYHLILFFRSLARSRDFFRSRARAMPTSGSNTLIFWMIYFMYY